MRKAALLGILGKRNDLFMLQIRQPFVITVGERAADDFFHDSRFVAHFEFFEGLVIPGTVDKLNIYRHMSFADKQIIINRPTDSAVAVDKRVRVLEGRMQPGDPRHTRLSTVTAE